MEEPMESPHRIPQIRLSIFNEIAHTMRVVKPFVWKETYLKVHPNGAAIFHEQKKLAFLLPLIVEAHELLPPTPLFWVNDDRTIPLWRTTLWLHEHTIQWLAETGESYPPELRDEIQPRLDQLKPSQPAKRSQPPTPPKPNRWTERPEEKQSGQAPQEAAPQDPKGTQNTPQQVADRERQYMELQYIFAKASQRTLAESRPTHSSQPTTPASLPAASQPKTGEADATLSSKTSTEAAVEAPAHQESHRPPKVSAQSLFNQRPTPPSQPATREPKTDTPGTGALSTNSPHSPAQTRAEQQQPPRQEQPGVDKEIPTEESTPVDTPNESPDTQVTATVVASSPEPASEADQEVDLLAADIPTLQNLQRAACEKVTYHETRLASARQNLYRITKRLKTIQDGQEPDTPQASPFMDIEMEIID